MNEAEDNKPICLRKSSIISCDNDDKMTESGADVKKINDDSMDIYESMKDDQTCNNDMETFDFTKTGAKPKQKQTQHIPPIFSINKSSLSNSTSSSLSSLSIISQSSSAPSNTSFKKSAFPKNKKHSKNSDETNYILDDANTDYDNEDILIIDDNNFYTEKFKTKDKQKLVLEATTPCPLCFKSIKTSLETHFQQEHNEFECAFCGLFFDSDYILNQHMTTMHIEEFNKNPKPFDSVANEAKNLKCPICMIVIKDDIQALEIHVDSHYNENKESSNDDFQMMSKNDFLLENNKRIDNDSRTPSDSSLVANVDENFEIDRIMTMADIEDIDQQNSCSNNEFEMCDFTGKSDYEIAMLLDQQERIACDNIDTYKSSEYLTAQLLEQHQQQEIENDLNYAIKLSCENDIDMEHESLKQKYGMDNTKASSRAENNLNKALKSHKIDLVTYHNQKSDIENRVNSSYDDGTTCSKGVIEILQLIQSNTKLITKRMICSKCDHYASGFIDNGYGCGYRNTQVLFSSIREDDRLRDTIFNNNNLKMPSITKIQSLIENAWKKGFDLEGKTQLGGTLVGTAKWIGGSDVCAMFSSLHIKCELIDIQPPKGVLIGPILFKYVKEYFEEQTANGQHVHPIYLQHDGHSRSIIGIEIGKSENLLLFDPSTRKNKIDQFRTSNNKPMQTFRRSVSVFNRYEAYQLVLIRGILETEQEYENAKILRSTRITS